MNDTAELFTYLDSPIEVERTVAESHRAVWSQLIDSGTWWTSQEILAIAARARAGFALRDQPPWNRDMPELTTTLPDAAIEAIDVLVSKPGSIDSAWATTQIAAIGDGHYVELVSVVATTIMVDMFAWCAGTAVESLPEPRPDSAPPAAEYPEGLGDIGAHVPMLDPFPYANVARALSLVPSSNILFRTTSVPMYSAPGMSDLVWDTPLSRPQVELVASRVAAMNECFY